MMSGKTQYCDHCRKRVVPSWRSLITDQLVIWNFCPKSLKSVLNQYTQHLSLNCLNLEHQSTYKIRHGCERALLKITNDILWSFEHQNVNGLLMMDLSTAFDTVDHNVLLYLLQKTFGLRETVLKWFTDYLSNRSFKVCVEGEYLDYVDVSFLSLRVVY